MVSIAAGASSGSGTSVGAKAERERPSRKFGENMAAKTGEAVERIFEDTRR